MTPCLLYILTTDENKTEKNFSQHLLPAYLAFLRKQNKQMNKFRFFGYFSMPFTANNLRAERNPTVGLSMRISALYSLSLACSILVLVQLPGIQSFLTECGSTNERETREQR